MTWLLYTALVIFLALPTLILLTWPALKLFDLKGWWRLIWLLGPALLLFDLAGYWQFLYLFGLPLMLLAWAADVIVARTWWVVLFGWPTWKEVTVSHTLERLIGDHDHKSWALAASIAQELDRISPGHIKALSK